MCFAQSGTHCVGNVKFAIAVLIALSASVKHNDTNYTHSEYIMPKDAALLSNFHAMQYDVSSYTQTLQIITV
jgi:hypothetical protein